jgi:hypothetical protein
MARKGFVKDNNKEDNIDWSKLDANLQSSGGLKSKVSVLGSRLLSVLKFILGLCLLTFVYSGSVGFLREFGLVEPLLKRYFWSGIISFIILYLFVYEPAKIYQKGQKLLGIIFKFFAPLVKVAPYVLPIYTIIIFCLYPLFHWIFSSKEPAVTNYFIFLAGSSWALHLIYSAKSLRYRQGDFLKANYIFGFSLVYIINLILIALCLSLIIKNFSFINFFDGAFQTAKKIFYAVFKQVFLPS